MFENVPQAPVQPAVPTPSKSAVPGQPNAPQAMPGAAVPPPSAALMADEAAIELFKRTGLSPRQKIILVVVTILVLSALIGGGIWIYFTVDPVAKSITNVNDTNNTNLSNVPLQELDTDKDGVRDIDEKRYSTDINLSDTDADGLSDYLEIFQYKTDPIVADTDGDTYLDGNEVDNGYDPNGPGKLAQ